MEEKDLEITQKVLNQINSFVKVYAQKNGYKLIIGTTEDGNLMYADETLDITDDVLSELNIKYLN
jgi:outer membrane protein